MANPAVSLAVWWIMNSIHHTARDTADQDRRDLLSLSPHVVRSGTLCVEYLQLLSQLRQRGHAVRKSLVCHGHHGQKLLW